MSGVVITLALAGCGRPAQQGQIFIATQGGQNVKLGAVEILAFDEATINSFLKQRQAEIAHQQDKLRQEAGAATNELERVDEPYKKARAEYLDAQRRYDGQADTVRHEAEKAKELDNRMGVVAATITDCNEKISLADQQIAGVLKDAEIRATIAKEELTRKEIFSRTNSDPMIRQAQDSKRHYQETLNEMLTKTNELKRLVMEQQTSLDTENQKLTGIEKEMTEKRQSAKSAEDAYRDAQRRLNVANQALEGFLPAEILFNGFPQPAVRTVSDAEGKFRLELPSGDRFALFAKAQRTVGQTETYYWLVWTDGKRDLLLNNANMFGATSSDQVVPTSASGGR